MSDANRYLGATRILDFNDPALVKQRLHILTNQKTDRQKLEALYDFVRSLPLGYSSNDDVPASQVLRDGYGQCNTKVNLLMALARGAGIPSRVHVFRISKDLQRGRIPGWIFYFAPDETVFTWPEFYIGKKWVELQVVVHEQQANWTACPFDGARYQLEPLRPGYIEYDAGVWDAPDDYYAKFPPTVHGWRSIGWKLLGRRVLNRECKACAIR